MNLFEMKKMHFVLYTLVIAFAFSNCNSQKKIATEKTTAQINLPEPYATPDTKRNSKVIGWPEGKTPIAPKGFKVTKYAGNLNNPRWFYITPNGDLLVSESQTSRKKSANNIILFRDTNGDGKPDIRQTFMKDLNQPLGMLVLGNWFYVGNTDGIYRYPYKPGQLEITANGEKITDLPPGGYNNHWTRNLIANADGTKLYVSTGSGSNDGEHGMEQEKRRACILEMKPDGSEEKVYAYGLRNPIGTAWEPATKKLWCVVNERDNLGDDLVPDYFTHVEEGGFYGWPYSYFGPHEDPRWKGKIPTGLLEKTLVPDVSMGAHTACLGLAFYTKKQFPEKYQGGVFIGEHGSWNRSQFAGYKVTFVPFKNGKPSGSPEDFLTGFIADESKNEVYGRPVGVTVMADGSMLVADDAGNSIWKVGMK
ncbi:MAG: sorbosone dehydrogenase family protein [Ginsengibacter sp.]